ncbi:BirA family biotin operon repressor/biotin-[acetyl-CoA-carboxylase] ligase [Thiogranum longum]|uniref:Bifunctional ligase/repressor BirA n=1 Tax=Thiogranum longum TaxID=1537524 RepID=A0A4R1HG67_9GAMM|nr:bifunctional biotin--[acetyl-CoA-carboxylase] ligase/biotin operon repressor BirA [Thiogranum longum]TCK19250.1 BirA family biotin operon repressor/biotin-[acetyl-CoA-carboxylase] ligase [Thiogranum longum]
MSIRYRLPGLLADGRFHSGEELAKALGVSRAAIWKQLRKFDELGLEIHAVRGRGYRLAVPFEPLEVSVIQQHLSTSLSQRIEHLEVQREVDSTSDVLKRMPPPVAPQGINVCLAEWQSAGRGRRGRRWISPYGTNLYLSLACMLEDGVLQSGGLSLAVAVAVRRTLQKLGIDGLGLKWPNDIYLNGNKLAGILLDLSGESGGNYQVIIGIGINLRMPEGAGAEIDQPWSDLRHNKLQLQRNRLAGKLLDDLVKVIEIFSRQGLEAFAEEWQRYDIAAGLPVDLQTGQQESIRGVARGVDPHGALLIEQDGRIQTFHAGEISVRLAG